jgi:hypothetical protein
MSTVRVLRDSLESSLHVLTGLRFTAKSVTIIGKEPTDEGKAADLKSILREGLMGAKAEDENRPMTSKMAANNEVRQRTPDKKAIRSFENELT